MAYHHGNLRKALIDTALALIGERGPSGFAFAEVARAAGVSPAAPYRHFRDRHALVAEVARIGFEHFADALEAAWDKGRPDPARAIENCCRAYLAFARREPAYYTAMFETTFPEGAHSGVTAASERAFGVLRSAAEAACATHKPEGRPPSLMVALHIWAMAHGVASLFVADGAARRKTPMAPEDLLEAGLLIYLQSLRLGR